MAETTKRPITKLLVANRSEIAIRVFRSAHELDIRTVALYAYEDRFALHRFKADEAYQVGMAGEPIRSYLNIDKIVALAVENGVNGVHPGYGFLSENSQFARACEKAGLTFVGPRPEILEQLGDKVTARRIAEQAGVPVLSGSSEPVKNAAEGLALANKIGFPVIVKAAMGGGGRGMRVALTADKLPEALDQAGREAGAAFGVADVFLEKFIRRARHIEVQLLGDKHGNLVHLYERDCSLQRRHQKIVEIAPALNLDRKVRDLILEAALKVGRAVGLDNAGTVEFLVDADEGKFYFIEVNPRIQVEHTVTEEVTGYDIVKSQLLIAQGLPLDHPEIGLGDQSKIQVNGFALQCRVTTEDPAQGFTPDYGRLTNYRSAAGLGVRLDAGTAFTGAVISPFYDSLLVKVTARGLTFLDAARRMERTLQEFRIRGVKTNIPFLTNLVRNDAFLEGGFTTRFIDETPELFQFTERRDRATRLLSYIGDVIVNGHPLISKKPAVTPRGVVAPPLSTKTAIPDGTRTRFKALGAEKFSKWIREQNQLFVTDTTMRDAHQSLLATRMRTFDMRQISPFYAHELSGLFSLEMWGGATFDTSLRFLRESPWGRLADLRERVPNILFQMLLRAANAVGYTNYPDNVVKAFVHEAAQAGIDVFRIFDSLNWLENMRGAMEAVRDEGMICEAAICYSGDILDERRTKYNLKYYVELAKQLEKSGANILAIKDMAGLVKPYAAKKLVGALRGEIGIPIHFHTHDCAGGQMASLLQGAEEGVDIVDAALAPMSGLTSQPCLNTLVEALRFTPRDTKLEFEPLQQAADYWEKVRPFYKPFESGQAAPSAEVYRHEMPGGQYTNLFEQGRALGLEARWPEVCRRYADVNQMFGDIVKVTPSSKVVGDMALFMVANNLTPEDVLDSKRELAFPESVVELMEGKLGQAPGGFPPALQTRVLRGKTPLTKRPGASLAPVDFADTELKLAEQIGREVSPQEVVTHLLYPRVFPEFAVFQQKYSDTSVLPTAIFFYGMEPGEEASIDIETGKTLVLKFITVGDPQPDATRTVFFELNGQPREVVIADRALKPTGEVHPKADPQDPLQIGSPMPGLVVTIAVKVGEAITAGQKLLTLEAMKMETTVYAEQDARIAKVLIPPGAQVEAGDLLIKLEK